MKQGIIVVNHGTSDFEARHNTIEEFVLSIGDRFEDADIATKRMLLASLIDRIEVRDMDIRIKFKISHKGQTHQQNTYCR